MNCFCGRLCDCSFDFGAQVGASDSPSNANLLVTLLRTFPNEVKVTYDRSSSVEKIYVTEDGIATYMISDGKVWRQEWELVEL